MTKNTAYQNALRLLTRREHGAIELSDKLARKGFGSDDIAEALARCQAVGLQSDERFVEGFTRMRIRQGYGPVKIKQELRSLSIEDGLISAALDAHQAQWLSYAQEVWDKKIRQVEDLPYEEVQKVQRFMLYRGFSVELINTLAKHYRQHEH